MTRHIHFCNVGKVPEPPLAVCLTEYPKDVIYLVNSSEADDEYTENEREVRRRLADVGLTAVQKITADPYDFENVTEAIERAVVAERAKGDDCRFHFNITAGSNIWAGAMCALALSMQDADIYHLREGKYCRPPSHEPKLTIVELADMESVKMLESKPMEARIMALLGDGPKPHRAVMEAFEGKGASLISYHMKLLTSAGLVVRGGESPKSPVWELSEKGRKVLRRYDIRNSESGDCRRFLERTHLDAPV